ncbi:hypothetical protein GCM10017771_28540 [Streptomyces capitiformicae]|uniref:Peptidase S8/S53 domain-containing protein n=1 Tax=Streptomyces capitiformicae TaxID=2014920 RepID=A0A919GPD5_9ACTN|nr:hypothetical protein GCM10017771_28540 [Streptomyces capitiformicae]
MTAYIIGTGVRISHSDFGGRASYGYDAVDDDDSSADDGNGHGTHVAGTVAGTTYGVAKAGDIVAVRVLDDDGSGTTAGVVAGIDWVTDNAQFPAVASVARRQRRLHPRRDRQQLHRGRHHLRRRGGTRTKAVRPGTPPPEAHGDLVGSLSTVIPAW